MSIGQNLKKLRAAAKLSQVDLAAKAGVSQQLISQIENDVNRDTTRLPELARALGCRVDAIDPEYHIAPAAIAERINAVLDELPEDDQERVMDFAQALARSKKASQQTQ